MAKTFPASCCYNVLYWFTSLHIETWTLSVYTVDALVVLGGGGGHHPRCTALFSAAADLVRLGVASFFASGRRRCSVTKVPRALCRALAAVLSVWSVLLRHVYHLLESGRVQIYDYARLSQKADHHRCYIIIIVVATVKKNCCRAMLCKRGLCRHAMSVRLSVCHVRIFCQNE